MKREIQQKVERIVDQINFVQIKESLALLRCFWAGSDRRYIIQESGEFHYICRPSYQVKRAHPVGQTEVMPVWRQQRGCGQWT